MDVEGEYAREDSEGNVDGIVVESSGSGLAQDDVSHFESEAGDDLLPRS